jgi:hypothetical protein
MEGIYVKVFAGWSVGSRRSIVLALSSSALVAAILVLACGASAATLTIEFAGNGKGTVTSSPAVSGPEEGASINCSNASGTKQGTCLVEFGEFDSISFTAIPGDSNTVFKGWTNDDPFGGFQANQCVGGEGGWVDPQNPEQAPQIKNPCQTLFHLEPFVLTATFKVVPPPPSARTGDAAVDPSGAAISLDGGVNPNGDKVDECHFEYGETTAYGSHAACVPGGLGLGEGTTEVSVTGDLETEQLKANTTYHYRLVASNFGGVGKGEDRTFTTGLAPVDACANAGIRATQALGAIRLPDCMALEMVSPPQKGGQPARLPAISADADGDRIIFKSPAALGGTSGAFNFSGDPYVATRGGTGWVTSPTSPLGGDFRTGWNPTGNARSFSPDFDRWFHIVATLPQFTAGVARAYHAGLGGFFAPISPLLKPRVIRDETGRFTVERTEFQAASADHSHLYFVPGPASEPEATATAYLSGDPEPVPASSADHNAYVATLSPGGEPALELLARDSQGKLWGGTCGTHIGGIEASTKNGNRNQGAVASDGSRVFFSARPGQPASGSCDSTTNKTRILERLETTQGINIKELFGSECTRAAPPCSSADGDDRFQGASVDGTKVYFTSNRQLANSDVDALDEECSVSAAVEGCDLYLYDSTQPLGQRLTQVSAGGSGDPTPGAGAKVFNGVTGISSDGSHVYYVAEGVLTTDPNPEGNAADDYSADTPKLYMYERDAAHPDGRTAFIGALDPDDGGPNNEFIGLWGTQGGTFRNGAYPVPVLGAGGGGAGDVLVFLSRARLSADDLDSGHRDVFRYDATDEALERVSKAAPSGADNGPFDVFRNSQDVAPLGTEFAESSRWVSEDGETVVFKIGDGLIPTDVNGVADSYLWRAGQLYRLPGTADTVGKLGDQPVLSHGGGEVAFQSFAQLLPQDGDTNLDVYVARPGGGYPPPPQTNPCDPLSDGSCQPQAGSAPAVTRAGSEVEPSAGNVKPKPKPCPKGKRKVKRKGKVRCVRPRRSQHAKHHRTARSYQGGAK